MPGEETTARAAVSVLTFHCCNASTSRPPLETHLFFHSLKEQKVGKTNEICGKKAFGVHDNNQAYSRGACHVCVCLQACVQEPSLVVQHGKETLFYFVLTLLFDACCEGWGFGKILLKFALTSLVFVASYARLPPGSRFHLKHQHLNVLLQRATAIQGFCGYNQALGQAKAVEAKPRAAMTGRFRVASQLCV